LLDVGALFHQNAPHFLALWAGLMRFQLHAEDRSSVLPHFVTRLGYFHAAAFAAAAGMYLCLDDPDAPAELVRGSQGLGHAEAGNRSRRGHAVLTQNFLGLIFVDLHPGVSLARGSCHTMAVGRENLTPTPAGTLTPVKSAPAV